MKIIEQHDGPNDLAIGIYDPPATPNVPSGGLNDLTDTLNDLAVGPNELPDGRNEPAVGLWKLTVGLWQLAAGLYYSSICA